MNNELLINSVDYHGQQLFNLILQKNNCLSPNRVDRDDNSASTIHSKQ
jgi:hypothetical protein